ncbi:MAG: chemotaxis protein CheW [Bacteroidota bacterium]|jgi:purine-binding chemotaxis protein CheW
MTENSPNIILMFRSHERMLAVPLENVIEVVPAFELLRTPGLAATLAGVISLRGDVLPVIDTAVLIGKSVTVLKPNHKFIIVRSSSQSLALLVDTVEELVEIGTGNPMDPMHDSGPLWFKGIVPVEEEMVLILDLDACYGSGALVMPAELNAAFTTLEGQLS